MSRRDLWPSQGPVSSSHPPGSCTPTAESAPPPYTTAAAGTQKKTASMTAKTLYDQPPGPKDGQFHPVYPEYFDLIGTGTSSNTVVGVAGQPSPVFTALYQAEGGFPFGWDEGQGLVEDGGQPLHSPDIIGDGGGFGLQPQASWDCCWGQTDPRMVGGPMPLASPMSQYAPIEEPMVDMGGCFEPPKWSPPAMGQIPPSPGQSSYYASSPASGVGGGPQFSRHGSCSSLAVEPSRLLDARPQTFPEQVLSPEDGQLSPGGVMVAGQRSHAGRKPQSNAGQRTEPRRLAARSSNTTTADRSKDTLSPAVTPSPKSAVAVAVPAGAGGQKQQQQPQPQPQPQPKKNQEVVPPPPPPQRTRNRAAATKCRAKSKLAAADLESTERAMSSEHQRLSMTARGLRDEVLLLKNELLAHGNCDDSLIQQYLTNQARMVGSGTFHQHQHLHQQMDGGGHG